jgi:hypothetical protein
MFYRTSASTKMVGSWATYMAEPKVTGFQPQGLSFFPSWADWMNASYHNAKFKLEGVHVSSQLPVPSNQRAQVSPMPTCQEYAVSRIQVARSKTILARNSWDDFLSIWLLDYHLL